MQRPQSDLTVRQHVDGANANLAFADKLKATGDTDASTLQWAITALFYAALHLVRAYLLARHSERVTTHDEMHGLLVKYPELKRTKPQYDHLKQESQAARYYLAKDFTWADYATLRSQCMRVFTTWQPRIAEATGGTAGS